jgi:hypothetical protein
VISGISSRDAALGSLGCFIGPFIQLDARRRRGSFERAWYVASMGRVAERSQLTAAEYLAWERAQPVKHEFFDGEVFAMAGGTPRHNALGISTNKGIP